MNELSVDSLSYILSRVLVNAKEATQETRSDRRDIFAAGRAEAYYEVLSILKAELDVRDFNLEKLGLQFNLEEDLL